MAVTISRDDMLLQCVDDVALVRLIFGDWFLSLVHTPAFCIHPCLGLVGYGGKGGEGDSVGVVVCVLYRKL